MLIIQQSSLRLENEKSNKVYEVDLVNVEKNDEKQYLVNFRYGRFESNLREGTKTVFPTTLEKAQEIYASLVVAKINKGYALTSGFDPRSGENIDLVDAIDESASAIEDVVEPLLAPPEQTMINENLLKRQNIVYDKFVKSLEDFGDIDQLNKYIWRLGELRINKAVPLLIKKIGYLSTIKNIQDLSRYSSGNNKSKDILNYTIAWTLGRCGDTEAKQSLNNLIEGKSPSFVKRMAIQAFFHVSMPSEQKILCDNYPSQLNNALRSIIEKGDTSGNNSQSLANDILGWAENHKTDNDKYKKGQRDPQIDITYLYLLSKENKTIRNSLLALCQLDLISFGRVWLVRLLFKIAEFELDAELLAVLVRQIEASKALPYRWQAHGEKDQRKFVSTYTNTRDYLRRRSWRLLRRLGDIEDGNYVDIATALLLQYKDNTQSDQDRAYSIKDDQRYYRDYNFPAFSRHFAFNKILYRHSEKIKDNSSGKQWEIINVSTDNKRTEAFPNLWDQNPSAFIECLKGSESQVVHDFALKGLIQQEAFYCNVSLADWVILLKTAYAETVLFSQKQIETNYPEAIKNLAFLMNVIPAKTQKARHFMQMHLRELPAEILREDIDWHVELITSKYDDNRLFSANFFYLYEGHPDKRKAVLTKTIHFILAMSPLSVETDDESQSVFPLKQHHWNDINNVILNSLSSETTILDFSVIRNLTTHPLIEVQRLGGKILILQKHQPEDIPDDIFMGLMDSEDGEMRSLGVRLLSNLSDDELANMSDLLVSLLNSTDLLVRQETRAIIKRVAATTKHNPQFSEGVLNALIPFVFKAENSEGQHDSLVECISEDLKSAWPAIDKDLLWRLLMAQSKAAQRVGSAVLIVRPHQDYSVRQWSYLAKHASKDVRVWACEAYTNHRDLICEQFPSALRILDNDWDDVREFSLDYFRNHFNTDDVNTVWSPDNLLVLCDSVRDDVQRLGRDLLRQFFNEDQGEAYLLRLSQHPSQNIQLFASEFLQNYAGGNAETLTKLHDYFITVLSGVNKGRVAKQRVLSFLLEEAHQSKEIAKQLSLILERQSVTVAIQDKGRFISAMLGLQKKYPDLVLPIQQKSVGIRGYGSASQNNQDNKKSTESEGA